MKKLFLFFISLSLAGFIQAQSAKDFYKDAKKSVRSEDYETAVGLLTKAITTDREYDDAYLLRGESYVKLNKTDLAIADYKKAAQYFDNKEDVQIETARLLYDDGQFEASIPYSKKALELDDDNLKALQLNFKALYETGKYAEAAKANAKAIEVEDENAENFYYQGLIAHKQENMPLAEAGLVQCAKLNGSYPNVYTALGSVRLDRKVYDKVIPTCDIAIKQNPKDQEAYLLKAEAYHQMGKTGDAVQTITDMIEEVGELPLAYRVRGEYQEKASNDLMAKKDYSRAISLKPDYMEALDKRAHLYEKEKESKMASNDYMTITKLEPVNDEQKKLIRDAKLRIYELNKEDKKPEISLMSPEVDDKSTVSILSNQGEQELKIQISDASDIKSVTLDGKELDITGSAHNPFIVTKIDLTDKSFFRIEAEDVYLNKASNTYNVRIKQLKPPTVHLNEPYASTNGETYVDKDLKDLFVEGTVKHSEKIKSIKVNGINASYIHDKLNPTFSAKIDISNLTRFTVEVEGVYGTTAQKEYTLVRTEVSADNPMGKTWVIFIENSNYEHFSSLEGPTKDINLIKSALAPYSISKVIHKGNMTKEDMAKFFSIELRDLIRKNRVNSLMVWYAGHGKFVNETGYWIPVDAKPDEEYSYYNINTLRASMQSYDKVLVHNLVITDACESGPSFYLAMRDAPKERVCGDWEATKFRSAQVLSSAGYELAVDNSQFTKTFAAMLTHNPDDCIPIEKISNKVIEAVQNTGSQKPSLGKIKGLEDQNGTFFFIKRD